MRHLILSSVTYLAVPDVSTFSHKRQDIREKKVLNINFVFRFSLQVLSHTFLILKIFQRVITIKIYRVFHDFRA